MHELSIAHTVTETALTELAKYPGHTVLKIALKIGTLSDVVPDSLLFGFDAIKQETVLANTELDIEIIHALGKCSQCAGTFELSELMFICPHCGGTDIEISGGRELEIAYLDIDEVDANNPIDKKGTAVSDGAD